MPWLSIGVGVVLVLAGGRLVAGGSLNAQRAERIADSLGSMAGQVGLPGYAAYGFAFALSTAAVPTPTAAPRVSASRRRPLHWAASSDDVDVAEALIDGGADTEAPAGSIAGGTPLDNAIGYGCWRVARLLVQRGAPVDKLWHAAVLGILARVGELLRGATSEEINNAFWQACHGGQRRAAELLLAHGADLNWVPDYAKGTPLDLAGNIDTGGEALVTWLRERGAQSASK